MDLCKESKDRYGLKGSTNISVEELVVIFLMILEHDFENRMVQQRFQHSRETVSRYFTHVLNDVLKMIEILLTHLINSSRMFFIKFMMIIISGLKNCIGVINGTYVVVKISLSK